MNRDFSKLLALAEEYEKQLPDLKLPGGRASDYPADLAGRIDHTLLKPEATAGQVVKLREEARQ